MLTDRQQIARNAAYNAWSAIAALDPIALGFIPNAEGIKAIDELARDIGPYSHTFRVQVRRADSVTVSPYVSIYAADEGCVNNGLKLAEAWKESRTYSLNPDRADYFYWES